MDVHSQEQRHRNMAAIRASNTKPEKEVRELLFSLGYRYRLHRQDLPGKPDIVLPKYKIAIFVNGCFWHRHEGCRYAATPSTRYEWWQEKFKSNVTRDQRNYALLREKGWQVMVIWECQVKELIRSHSIPGMPSKEI